jgi:hypothetical protein
LRYCAALGLFFAAAACGALDLTVRPGGFVYIPAGDRAEYYTPGGGGGLGLDFTLPSFGSRGFLRGLSGLGGSAGLEVDYAYAPLGQNTDGGLQLYSAGGTLALHYFLLSRIFLRADTALGWYQGVSANASSGALWYRAGGDLGFRFGPSVILSAGGGYGHYENRDGGSLYSGLYAGLRLQFNFTMGPGVSGVEVEFAQDDTVYPPFLSLYQKVQAGALTIVNHENAELRNVEVSFRAGDYTSSEFICGVIPFIGRERQGSIPLYADFSPKLLNFTENGRIIGEVVIRYSFLGSRRETVQSAALRIAHRNSVPAGDPAAPAALVSPTAPELLEYAKHITGMARLQSRTGLNRNMQFGIWLFEGLLASGLQLEQAGSSGFSALAGVVEDIQYPAQTLAYRSGSAADIGLAYAAALEASGIPSAFIPLSDDFILAFHLGITGEEARSFFNDTGHLLIIDGEAWLPLSMACFNDGFSKSWQGALDRIDRLRDDETASFIVVQDSWAVYPPVPFPALGVRIAEPDTKDLEARVAAALDEYIAGEIQPLIAATLSQIREAAGPELATLRNRLGALYIRMGSMASARTAYEQAAGMGSVPAATNLGNMALRENDLVTARRWFDQALRLQPGNRTALRGLEQISQRTGR